MNAKPHIIGPNAGYTPSMPVFDPYYYLGAVLNAINEATGSTYAYSDLVTNDGENPLSNFGIQPNTPQIHALRQRLQYRFQIDVPLSLLNTDGCAIEDVDDYIYNLVTNQSFVTHQIGYPPPPVQE